MNGYENVEVVALMNVFISYSGADLSSVRQIAEKIKPFAGPKFWDQDQMPGKEAWPTIFSWIDSAKCAIVVITDNVVARGESVNQEIGYARAKGKIIIPLVSNGVPKDRLGCLNGVTYIPFDTAQPQAAIDAIILQIKSLLSEADFWTVIVVLGIIGFVFALTR